MIVKHMISSGKMSPEDVNSEREREREDRHTFIVREGKSDDKGKYKGSFSF